MRTDCPPADQQIQYFTQIAMNAENYPILIHCVQGVIRTNMMVAVFLKHYHGMDNHTIIENLPFFGHALEKRPKVRDFILNYSSFPSIE